MKYIRALEAAGFGRDQAEAQVQVVLDAVEGELVTKSDFALFQERLGHRFLRIDQRFVEMEQRFDQRFIEMEFKPRDPARLFDREFGLDCRGGSDLADQNITEFCDPILQNK